MSGAPDLDGCDVVRLAEPDHRRQAVGVAARALRDNPLSLVFSADPFVRMKLLYDVFVNQLVVEQPEPAGARLGSAVIAIAGVDAVGRCLGSQYQNAEALAAAAPAADATDIERLIYTGAMMASHDLAEPHRHVGPVGVEPGFQGRGIGRQVMGLVCADLDRDGEIGWLETDKPENVRFYNGLGFVVVEEARVIDATIWFMRRDPS